MKLFSVGALLSKIGDITHFSSVEKGETITDCARLQSSSMYPVLLTLSVRLRRSSSQFGNKLSESYGVRLFPPGVLVMRLLFIVKSDSNHTWWKFYYLKSSSH